MAARRVNGEGSKPFQRAGRKGWYSQVRITDPVTGQSRRVLVSAPTQTELRRKVTKTISDAEAGRLPAADKRLTLNDYAARWVQTHLPARDVTPSTRRLYRHALDSYVLDLLGTVRMSQLRAAHAEQLDAHLREEGRSQSTRRLAYNVLRMVFDTAVRDQVVAANPVVGAARPSENPTTQPYYKPGELARLFEVVEGHRTVEQLVPLLAWTAMRCGEGLALRWSDVDLDSKAPNVWVNGTLAVDEKGRVYRQPFTKSKTPRQVPLLPAAVHALTSARRAQAADRLAAGEAWADNDLVFADPLGRVIDDRGLRRQYAPLVKEAGLTGSFHALRRSTATMLTAAGKPLNVVAVILGHSSTAITQERYTIVDTSLTGAALDELAAYYEETRHGQ